MTDNLSCEISFSVNLTSFESKAKHNTFRVHPRKSMHRNENEISLFLAYTISRR